MLAMLGPLQQLFWAEPALIDLRRFSVSHEVLWECGASPHRFFALRLIQSDTKTCRTPKAGAN